MTNYYREEGFVSDDDFLNNKVRQTDNDGQEAESFQSQQFLGQVLITNIILQIAANGESILALYL